VAPHVPGLTMQEIIIYRSPLEKVVTDYLMEHPGVLLVMYALFGLFFLLVLAGVVTVFWKVFKAFCEDTHPRNDRWR
jgi:hypothetical protein